VAARLTLLATRAAASARTLAQGNRHTMLLAGMIGHYLSAPSARAPDALPATKGVLKAVGGLTAPAMLMLKASHGRTAPPPGYALCAPALSAGSAASAGSAPEALSAPAETTPSASIPVASLPPLSRTR
jgi:hypothetical protein